MNEYPRRQRSTVAAWLTSAYIPAMNDKRLQMRLPEELLQRLDEWRADRDVPAPRSAAVRFMLDWWLKENAPWLTKKADSDE